MNIIFEDKDIIVVYKEAGLPVQSARGMDLESMLKNKLREANPGGPAPYLGVVHRLDQPVEGLLAFAKTKKAAASLSAQVQDGRMKKIYRAIVLPDPKVYPEGQVPAEATLTDYLLRDAKTNSSRIVKEGTKDAKKAVLDYKVLDGQNEDAAGRQLLEIHLHTGRHHQIRVQMAGAHMPLDGDRKYAANAAGQSGRRFPALCAYELSFVHPVTGKTMHFDLSGNKGYEAGTFMKQ